MPRKLFSTAAAPVVAALVAGIALGGCADRSTAPAQRDASRDALEAAPTYGAIAANVTHTVKLMDACDPRTFTPCGRETGGGVSNENFFKQLTQTGQVGSWHMSPGSVHAFVGQTLASINVGGRQHTFTEVEEFGGGVVPILNTLSGNPVPAPECLALAPADFLNPGQGTSEVLDEEGTEHYQCCIHPWMRMTLEVKAH